MKSLLRADHITCSRGDNILFQNFCMEINEGEILQVVGPNGAGKTSLLKILAGILEPQKGIIFWKGQAIKSNLYSYFQKIFYLGHHRGIKSQLSVLENLTLDCRYTSNQEIIMDAIKQMNLLDDKQTLCMNLSEGQRQRVALAKLLIVDRPLWILDEPLNGLDNSGVKIFEKLLNSKMQKKESIIISTHRPLNLSNFLLKTLDLSCAVGN